MFMCDVISCLLNANDEILNLGRVDDATIIDSGMRNSILLGKLLNRRRIIIWIFVYHRSMGYCIL